MRQAKHPESEEHPLGHEQAVYFWSMMVAILLFFVGGLFSIYEGYHRLTASEPLRNAGVAPIAGDRHRSGDGVAMGALREIRKVRAGRTFWRWFRETRQSELMVVAGEDIAALGGLVFAFVAVLLAMWSGDPLFDALGSIAVGVLLVVVAVAIAEEIKAMIIGESASPSCARKSSSTSVATEVKTIMRLITLQWGNRIVVAVRAEMAPVAGADELIAPQSRRRFDSDPVSAGVLGVL